jgi:hypothetical protein
MSLTTSYHHMFSSTQTIHPIVVRRSMLMALQGVESKPCLSEGMKSAPLQMKQFQLTTAEFYVAYIVALWPVKTMQRG